MSPHAFHPVMTCAEAREFERTFFAGDADGSRARGAMRLAAFGVARETRRLLEETSGDVSRLFVLCGKGRNAGDALLAAADLLTPGAECLVCAPEGVARLSAEAARALEHLMSKSGAGVRVAESWDCEFVRRPCVILDGLTGSGFRPPLSGAMREAVLGANRCENALRVAVDLPSGAGDKSDALLFAAHLTVATGILKSPMLSPEARASAGRIRYADIGFFDGGAPESSVSVVSPAGLRELDAPRHAMSDKRDHGHVAVIGGHRMMPGALLLNVLGALRAGAGLVTAFCPASVHAAFAAAAPEAMWVPMPEAEDGGLAPSGLAVALGRLARADALVCGSGLGASPGSLGLVSEILMRSEIPAVVDADAIRPEVLRVLPARPPGAGAVVVTPHGGEFERIAGREAGEGFSTLGAVAREFGVVVAHKGPCTRVADGSRGVVIPYGGPALARGDSGDLLAGITGALLARIPRPAVECAALAAAWHGAAADHVASRRGAVALRTSELLDGLGPCLRG